MTLLAKDQAVTHEIVSGRKGWVHVARGSVDIDDQRLYSGDGVAIEGSRTITLTGESNTEVLLFDMG